MFVCVSFSAFILILSKKKKKNLQLYVLLLFLYILNSVLVSVCFISLFKFSIFHLIFEFYYSFISKK